MSLFCRHKWDYIKAKTETQLRSDRICGKQCVVPITRCGVSVYCTKCGKVNKRLSMKLGRLYATHLANKSKNKALEKVNKTDFMKVKVDISKIKLDNGNQS